MSLSENLTNLCWMNLHGASVLYLYNCSLANQVAVATFQTLHCRIDGNGKRNGMSCCCWAIPPAFPAIYWTFYYSQNTKRPTIAGLHSYFMISYSSPRPLRPVWPVITGFLQSSTIEIVRSATLNVEQQWATSFFSFTRCTTGLQRAKLN